MSTISQFRGEYAFLSNFSISPLSVYGKSYPTAEHAFQAMKTNNSVAKEAIRKAATPAIAKKLGREALLRTDWEQVKFDAMHAVLTLKFAPGSLLAQKLVATGDAKLVEGNTWGDTCWGVCGEAGENHLGKILMQIRKALKENKGGIGGS